MREAEENPPFFWMGIGGSPGPRDYYLKVSVFAVFRICAISGRKSAFTRLTLGAMLHPGSTVSLPPHREAHIRTALSFQNLEAALPPGIPAGEPIQ